ncbi:threonine/serine exporter family protein [Maribellus sp. YY47]|uniref:threonine/serine ThrE exporter family protein n=1 Tax=Maribellus sp. YY47 TaxID=2929486 RepID=UPI002001263C|nr:threonine/serine exporter family protein [Maribellus sp. YY47]MCK3685689.1 threonine/serine exporter family protein [Maribellus sp. YY47]
MGLTDEEKVNELSKVLLEVGSLLMSSGANSSRIRITISRIAGAFGYDVDLLITHRALMMTIYDEETDFFFSRLKRTSPHGVNFRMVSGISRMSWRIVQEKWEIDQVKNELERLKSLSHYPRILVLAMVSAAGAGFCRVFGGVYLELLVTFVATFIGLYVRQEAVKKAFNPYLAIFFAAFVSSMIAGLALKMKIGPNPEYAFATSVLYLIPGIPLINSLSDLLDGNIMNGIVRGLNGLMISFAIALGMLGAVLIYGI